MYGGITGRSELVKRLYQRLLLPYLRRPLGWVLLFLSGRRVREERQRLRAHVDGVLEGRGAERLAGLDQLIALVVALRALAAQRALTGLLRLWLPLHLGVAAVAAVLLAFHLAEVLLR